MRKITTLFLCLVFAFSGVVLAENPPEGGIGDQNGGGTCSTCTTNLWGDEGVCNPNPAGNWADCTGGKICYNDSTDGRKCYIFCGTQRCYYV
jgi:hypothetical protein